MTESNSHLRFLSDLEREITAFQRSLSSQPKKPPDPSPTAQYLSDISSQPLFWLWPGRIPLGHLTLLDGARASGLSLLALTLAACVSRGSPLPDGTPTPRGKVILLAPYDSPADTLKPRLEAAGGDASQVLLIHPLVEDASRTLARTRSFALPQDLDTLAALIHHLKARLVILDPASAMAGLSRCLPALIELAHQANCAILLTRSLREPPADPLHSPGPSSPFLEAARSRLLLAPDPGDERRHLLLTTKHPFCPQPGMLTYDILASPSGIPTIHWLGEQDRSHLARLCTGPIRSPQRQAILHFLHNSATPQTTQEILQATCYDREAGRKMLFRMRLAGELVSLASGLYTTPNHPCLLPSPDHSPVPSVPSSQSSPLAHSPQSDVTSTPAVPATDPPTSTTPPVPSVPPVPPVPSSQSPTLANSPQGDAPAVPVTHPPASTLPPVPNVPPVPNPAGELTETSVGADLSCPSPIYRPVSPPACSPAESVPAIPVTDPTASTLPPVPSVPSVPSSQSPTLANSPQGDLPAIPITDPPTSTLPPVP